MIRENINVTINSYNFEGEIIVPSQVMTATPQEEDINLSYTPNFQLKLQDSYSYVTVTDTVYATFNVASYDWAAYMNAINRNGSYVTLQYVDGLNSSYSPSPEPQPDPELSAQINSILGSDYNVINDMSDEDAIAAANNILYGEEPQ